MPVPLLMGVRSDRRRDHQDPFPASPPPSQQPGGTAIANIPRLAAAKRLPADAKDQGLTLKQTNPDEDTPPLGAQETAERVDEIVLAGFSEAESCCALRRRRPLLVVPGGLPVAERVSGNALTGLHTVLWDWAPDPLS